MFDATDDAKDCANCKWKRKSEESCEPCPRPTIPYDMVDSYSLFVNSLTQVRTSFGGVVGLDYTGVKAAAEMMGLEMTDVIFQDLRTMENEYLTIIREESKSDG